MRDDVSTQEELNVHQLVQTELIAYGIVPMRTFAELAARAEELPEGVVRVYRLVEYVGSYEVIARSIETSARVRTPIHNLTITTSVVDANASQRAALDETRVAHQRLADLAALVGTALGLQWPTADDVYVALTPSLSPWSAPRKLFGRGEDGDRFLTAVCALVNRLPDLANRAWASIRSAPPLREDPSVEGQPARALAALHALLYDEAPSEFWLKSIFWAPFRDAVRELHKETK